MVVSRVPELGPLALVGLTPQFVALFVLGMLAAHICYAWPAARDRVPWSAVFAGLGTGFVALCAGLGRDTVFAHLSSVDLYAGLVAAALLVVLGRPRPSRARSLLGGRPLFFLGTFAYSTYLVHAPLVELVWRYAVAPLQLAPMEAFAALVLVGTPAVLAEWQPFDPGV